MQEEGIQAQHVHDTFSPCEKKKRLVAVQLVRALLFRVQLFLLLWIILVLQTSTHYTKHTKQDKPILVV